MVAIPQPVLDALGSAKRVVALTGAGVSQESGVPTFRAAQTGWWANFKPEELATPEAFLRNPRLVWEWYAWRRELVKQVQPNAAHLALAEMARRIPQFTLITQNVDGLHQRAGSPEVIELHGNITRTKCFDEGAVVQQWIEDGSIPPRCPACRGMLRPDVVWFNEALPPGVFERALDEARAAEVFLSIGTSAVVYPAAALPEEALARGAMVIEINSEATPLSDAVTCSLRGNAGVLLPRLL